MKRSIFDQQSGFTQVLGLLLCSLACSLSERASAEEPSPNLPLLKTFVSEFISITPGHNQFPATFEFGSVHGSTTEQPVREVTLTQNFSIAKYEVYQNLYSAVMGTNPSRWQGPRNSAERMAHDDAVRFCQKITELLRKQQLITANQVVRLPTEIEWEYCTRAGTKTRFSFGDAAQSATDQGNSATLLDPYGWHTGNAAGNDPAVGVLKPNPWGLYDVHGYLAEYCQGSWTANHAEGTPPSTEMVVLRGGSWKDPFPMLTSSARRPFPRSGRDDAVGFRCVLSAE